jgi:hypothetical protein
MNGWQLCPGLVDPETWPAYFQAARHIIWIHMFILIFSDVVIRPGC